MARFRKGNWYRVRFLDHVMGEGRHVTCVIFGYVVKVTDASIVFSWWECEDMDLKEDNAELVTIIKNTIVCAKPIDKDLLK